MLWDAMHMYLKLICSACEAATSSPLHIKLPSEQLPSGIVTYRMTHAMTYDALLPDSRIGKESPDTSS